MSMLLHFLVNIRMPFCCMYYTQGWNCCALGRHFQIVSPQIVQIYTPPGSIWEFQLFHTLSNTWEYILLILDILVRFYSHIKFFVFISEAPRYLIFLRQLPVAQFTFFLISCVLQFFVFVIFLYIDFVPSNFAEIHLIILLVRLLSGFLLILSCLLQIMTALFISDPCTFFPFFFLFFCLIAFASIFSTMLHRIDES